ncbi:MAG TPA: pyroglutamyl-peptidase I [Micromonosporaceae bacterium]|nr:pyroglutamyl-peptidase I [Micromonosporaceae bacterium]
MALRRRVLMTGFGPFGGASGNPSQDAVHLLAGSPPEQVDLVTAVLPCVFGAASEVLWAAVREHDPDVVIATGLAGGRAGVSVERVAVNLEDARIPDNSGAQPVDRPVVAGGPAAYFATIPVKACAAAVRALDIPAVVSHTAGTFVCNSVFYSVLHRAAQHGSAIRAGFVHVPYAMGQGGPADAVLPLEVLARALAAVAVTAASTTTDLAVPAGALH